METEESLERVPPTVEKNYEGRYFIVGPLYFEHLQRIYDLMDSTLTEAQEKRIRQLEKLRSIESSYQKSGSEPVPAIVISEIERFSRPLITMKNEEFKFESLAKVYGFKRRYFKTFTFETSDLLGARVWIDQPMAMVTVPKCK